MKRINNILNFYLLLTIFATSAHSQNFISKSFCRVHSPALTITDNLPAGVNSDLDISVPYPNNAYYQSLRVSLKATHPWIGDLKASVQNVGSGALVTLFDRPGFPASGFGCGRDNLNLIFDDYGSGGLYEDAACAGPASSFAAVSPPNYQPAGSPLNGFFELIAYPISGTWRLNIADFANPDAGTLSEWCLIVDFLDEDQDGVPNGFDNCSDVSNPDQADIDSDGVGNVCDNCPSKANPFQENPDKDGAGDACDLCLGDPIKTGPGVCGCGTPDVDTNGDGTIDCDSNPSLTMLSTTGVLLVPDTTNNRVMTFDPSTGKLLNPNFIPTDNINLSTPAQAILSKDKTKILVAETTKDSIVAYNFSGSPVGVFAPQGGVNSAIMDSPRSIELMPDGRMLAAVGSGANANNIIIFDSVSGAYGGVFVNGPAISLSLTQGMLLSGSSLLVSNTGSDNILRLNASTGVLISTFANINNPQQLTHGRNSNYFAAFQDATSGIESVIEYDLNGNQKGEILKVPYMSTIRSAWELDNGKLLLSGALGVKIINRQGLIENTVLSSGSMRFVSLALIDSDSDGKGDNLDACPNDASKVLPGICGCGKSDSDLNANGVADCLKGGELKSKIQQVIKLLKSVKAPKTQKQKSTQKTIKKNINLLLKDISSYSTANIAEINIKSGANLKSLVKTAKSSVTKTLKFQASFKADKINAAKSLNGIIAILIGL